MQAQHLPTMASGRKRSQEMSVSRMHSVGWVLISWGTISQKSEVANPKLWALGNLSPSPASSFLKLRIQPQSPLFMLKKQGNNRICFSLIESASMKQRTPSSPKEPPPPPPSLSASSSPTSSFSSASVLGHTPDKSSPAQVRALQGPAQEMGEPAIHAPH